MSAAPQGDPIDGLGHALQLAAKGLHVFPLQARSKVPQRGAEWARWQDYATADPHMVRRLWVRAGMDANPAVLMGAVMPNGWVLVGLDVDERDELRGREALEVLEGELGPLPATPRVQSGRQNGSFHLYLLVPAGAELRNIKLDPAGGVQLKAHNGYLVGPGAIHPDTGLPYLWEEGWELAVDLYPGEMPPRWLAYLTSRMEPPVATHGPVAPGRMELPGDHLPGWTELLTRHGARYVGTKFVQGAPCQAWLRPAGSNPPTSDHSAVVLDAGLWVYTDAWPTRMQGRTLEPSESRGGHTYSRLGFEAAMRHGDDSDESVRRTAGELRGELGLGPPASILGPGMRDHVVTPRRIVDTSSRETEQDGEGELEASSSWAPIDLDPYINGEHVSPMPNLLLRSDGVGLFYRGAVNGLHGDSGIGKSWLASLAVLHEARAGRTVLIVDFEDTPTTLVDRLRMLKLSPDTVRTRIIYVRPQDPITQEDLDALLVLIEARGVSLVVLDSVGEAMAVEGINEDRDNEVAPWIRGLPRRLADAGPAVLLIDHGTKSADNPLYQSGSKRKRAGLTGSSFLVTEDTEAPLGRAEGGEPRTGWLYLTTAKDRHGFFPRGKPAGALQFVAHPDGSVEATLWAPSGPTVVEPDHVVVVLCAQSAVNACREEGGRLSQRSLEGRMRMKARGELKRSGIALAVDRGALEVTAGRNRSMLYGYLKELPIRGGDR